MRLEREILGRRKNKKMINQNLRDARIEAAGGIAHRDPRKKISRRARPKNLNHALRNSRIFQNNSLSQLVERTGIHQVELTRYEMGHRIPSFNNAMNLSVALNKPIFQLFPDSYEKIYEKVDYQQECSVSVERGGLKEKLVDSEFPEKELELRELREKLGAIILTLNLKQKKVIELLYGLTGDNPRTAIEVGETLSLTRQGVDYLKVNALKSLKLHLNSTTFADYLK